MRSSPHGAWPAACSFSSWPSIAEADGLVRVDGDDPRPALDPAQPARRQHGGVAGEHVAVDEPDLRAAGRRVVGGGVRVTARVQPDDHRLPGIGGGRGRGGGGRGGGGQRDPGGDRHREPGPENGPGLVPSFLHALPSTVPGSAAEDGGTRDTASSGAALHHPVGWNDHAVAYRRTRSSTAPPVRGRRDAAGHPLRRIPVALHPGRGCSMDP